MPFIAWQPQLSVGIRQFDDDHMALIDLINELWEANDNREGDAVIDRILGDLADYVDYHFKREEDLFRRWGFPGAAGHAALHDKLTAQVADLKRMVAGKGTIAAEVFEFLRDWLIKHILGEDMVYASYFRALGIDDIDKAVGTKRRSPLSGRLVLGGLASRSSLAR
jgi:hemerythrin-like metal-binding protein